MTYKCKINAAQARIGMYVVELDRPWLGTPFMFQGFPITDEQELAQVRKFCESVVVDLDRSTSGSDDTTEVRTRIPARAAPLPTIPEAASPPAPDRRRAHRDVRKQLGKAVEIRAATRRYIARAFSDARLGRSIDTEAAQALVAGLVQTVTDDADALIWITKLSKKHEYTVQHSINVAVLALAFANHLGYPFEQLKVIGLGALLHDIGKMRVPPEILNKPGRLTDDEMDIIRRHPVDGYDIVRENSGGRIPEEALMIIRHHHERIDGRGYPDGLKGAEIPQHAMLVAVVDAYDAMTTNRSYHRAISSDRALSRLYRAGADEFGSELVAEFIRCIGIYPVGSLVQLSTGALAVVLTNEPGSRLNPYVMIVRDARGRPCVPRRHLSLASQRGDKPLTIRRIVAPEDYGIDLQWILAEELEAGGLPVAV